MTMGGLLHEDYLHSGLDRRHHRLRTTAPPPPEKKSGRGIASRSTRCTPDRPKAKRCRRVFFSDDDMVRKPSSRSLVMGEVRILKRGEALTSKSTGSDAVDLISDGEALAARSSGSDALDSRSDRKALMTTGLDAVDPRSDGEASKTRSIRSKAVDRSWDREALTASSTRSSTLLSSPPRLLGPKPKLLPKQIRVDQMQDYAGPATISSPSPSSLPFPVMFMKKAAITPDLVTKGLLSLLRLETP